MAVDNKNSTADREIVTTRLVNASSDQVFKAWTNPHLLAQWWGPKDFKNTFHEFDLKPGGHWDFVMHGPNGTDYPNSSTFVEIKPPERLVFNHVSKPEFQVITTFADEGSKTKVTFRQIFPTAKECETIRKFAANANEENMDRLEAVVAEMILDRSNREILTTRMFEAPIELIFAAWTDPKHLSQWWGPNGFTISTHTMDLKPGGLWRFMMHGPDGNNFPNLIEFTEVVKPSMLAYKHGSDNEPDQFRTTVHLERQGDQTKLTMRGLFPTAQALEAVKKFGAVEGGKQTLERLAGFLAKIKS